MGAGLLPPERTALRGAGQRGGNLHEDVSGPHHQVQGGLHPVGHGARPDADQRQPAEHAGDGGAGTAHRRAAAGRRQGQETSSSPLAHAAMARSTPSRENFCTSSARSSFASQPSWTGSSPSFTRPLRDENSRSFSAPLRASCSPAARSKIRPSARTSCPSRLARRSPARWAVRIAAAPWCRTGFALSATRSLPRSSRTPSSGIPT